MGPTELIVILLVVVLLFGASRLPKLARSLGESAKEFKKGVDDIERDRDLKAQAEAEAEAKGKTDDGPSSST